MSAGILELTLFLLITAALGIMLKLLRQPLILAYIATGVVLTVFGFLSAGNKEVFDVFLRLGLTFLLFLVGMEINYTALRIVGRAAVTIGIGQIAFTTLLGFPIARAVGFDVAQSWYLALALAFSSAIVVVRLLSERNAQNSLYGKISLGVLLVQSLAAIAALFALSGASNASSFLPMPILLALAKGAVLFFAIMYLGRKLIPPLLEKIAGSNELLLITSIAWCLGAAALVMKAGFPVEIGGFLAGIAIANSSERFQIAYKIRALRDLFALVFFALLGSSLVMLNFQVIALPLIVFSLFVLIGNPLVVLLFMRLLGYVKRTSFFTGITIAQTSEFSLIFASLGLILGNIKEHTASIITAVTVVTIVASSYLILHGNSLYKFFSPVLSLFEKKRKKEEPDTGEARKQIVLIGFHRLGENIASHLRKQDLLVVDFNPDAVRALRNGNYSVLFGDIADENILERVGIARARLIVCTSPSLQDNLTLITAVSRFPSRPVLILRAENENDARTLYAHKETGYVIVPNLTEGQYLGKTIAVDPALKILPQLKQHDLAVLSAKH